MGYIISFVILTALFVFGFFTLDRLKNVKKTNAVFIVSVFVCYMALVLIAYLQNGLSDWNFLVTLPTANVSPFMFCSVILLFVLPKKQKTFHFSLISLLIFGMFMSPTLSMMQRIFTGYAFHFQFLLDYVAHYLLCLFGIYLCRSRQITLTKRNALVGGSLIVAVALFMMLFNLLFGTAFFGLSLGEGYNIYNLKIVPNPYLSLLLYFAGLIGVLMIGYLLQIYILPKIKKTEL